MVVSAQEKDGKVHIDLLIDDIVTHAELGHGILIEKPGDTVQQLSVNKLLKESLGREWSS
jgi:hypothetical protein